MGGRLKPRSTRCGRNQESDTRIVDGKKSFVQRPLSGGDHNINIYVIVVVRDTAFPKVRCPRLNPQPFIPTLRRSPIRS